MFFAPPKVKSLSRYSEFGVNLQHRHFMIMLCIALFIHAGIIAIYAIIPGETVVRIPVRVLNIKLSGGPSSDDMPTPAMMPGVENDMAQEKPASPQPAHRRDTQGNSEGMDEHSSAQSAVDSAMGDSAVKPKLTHADANPKAPKLPPVTKVKHTKDAQSGQDVPAPEEDMTFATPKKYVRGSDDADETGKHKKKAAKASAGGNGSDVAGTKGGEEVVQRYEQLISIWIADHKSYPAEAKRDHIEGSAVVRIRIGRDGHILYSAIDRTSGNAVIDAAALAMVKTSDPVPAVPGDYPDASKLEFLIPVDFYLN